MQKSNNESYNRILEYILNNPNIEEDERRTLISYATILKSSNVENIETENIETILADLKRLNESLKSSNDTSLVAKRIEEELEIFEMINNHYKLGEQNLELISYMLDKLYMDTDLKVRKGSSLSYNLINKKSVREK